MLGDRYKGKTYEDALVELMWRFSELNGSERYSFLRISNYLIGEERSTGYRVMVDGYYSDEDIFTLDGFHAFRDKAKAWLLKYREGNCKIDFKYCRKCLGREE